MKLKRLIATSLVGGTCFVTALSGYAQGVEKVADFFTGLDGLGQPYGGVVPLDRFTQVGTNLWFTTSQGGKFTVGTLSRFDLVTREIVQVLSMDTSVANNIGGMPESTVLVIGEEAYFTARTGGTADEGSIVRFNLNTGATSNLYSFPINSLENRTNGVQTGSTPRAGFTRIGDELWTLTQAGGAATNRGTLVKINLTNNTFTAVTNFDGGLIGGQPYDRLVQVSNAYYFTTFTGGVNPGASHGTLSRLTFDESGNPVITRLVSLPAGYSQFAANTPTPVGNSLYFTTVGASPTVTPGAIMRYDISTGLITNVFNFTNTAAADFGKQAGYNGLTEWQGELYFMTRQGGISNMGVIAKFNIASNTVFKLADLRGVGPDSLGNASGSFNSGTVVEETNRFFMYFPVSRGGANAPPGFTTGLGTIVRILLPPPLMQLAISNSAPDAMTLSWTGGYLPFSVQARDNLLTGSWTNLVEGLTNRTFTVTNAPGQAYFRVGGS